MNFTEKTLTKDKIHHHYNYQFSTEDGIWYPHIFNLYASNSAITNNSISNVASGIGSHCMGIAETELNGLL